jgi:glutathione synthase/RimK-type ligase-like ATP-grasp enzyme
MMGILAEANAIYPPALELKLWENKIFMHRRFEHFEINSPKTIIIDGMEIEKELLDFPFLVKEPFANHSKGIYKIENSDDYENYLGVNRRTSRYLVQELVNMSKDARVVVIGGKVVYHYWREKNVSADWSTTSTSNGSRLDLSPLPPHVVDTLIDYNERLGINIGAYDVTFFDDNLESVPIVLEVSTSFLMNPLPPKKYEDKSYLEFKSKSFRFAGLRIQGMIDLKAKQFDSY